MRFITTAVIFFSALLSVDTANAADPSRDEPRIADARWVDIRGEVVEGWPSDFEWAWREFETAPLSRPVFRTWLRPPSGLNFKLKKKEKLLIMADRGDSPFEEGGLAIDGIDRGGLEFTVEEGGKRRELALIALVNPSANLLSTSPPCAEEGLHLKENRGFGEVMFNRLGIHCEFDGTALRVWVFPPEGAASGLIAARGFKTDAESRRTGIREYHLTPDDGNWKAGSVVAYVDLTDANGKKARVSMLYSPNDDEKPWGFDVGTGVTYLSYSETALGIELSEIAHTVKLGAHYRINKNFNIHGNAYVNTLPGILSATGTETAARILGLNSRLAYRLPIQSRLRFQANLGVFFWKMIVDSDRYGLSIFGGPQLLISADIPLAGRWHGAYVKFASVGDSADSILGFSNFESAFGAWYDPAWNAFGKRLVLTLDVALTFIGEVEGSPYTIRSTAITPGIKMKF